MRLDPKQWRIGQPYPPLATIAAAAYIRRYGWDVALHDVQFDEGLSLFEQALEDHQPRFLVVYDDGFNYLTKMCLTNMREAAFAMIRLAKLKGLTVIVCSSDATDHCQNYLSNGAGYVIKGEGEQGLLELLHCLENDLPVSEVAGIAYLHDGRLHQAIPRPVMKDLDALPLPAWDLVDLQRYRKAWIKKTGYFSINISTTRGCPFKCNWCAKPIYGNRYNVRSPEHVISELKLLAQMTSFDHVWFCDDIFGLKPGWVQKFADLVNAEGFHFRFKIQSRADLLLETNYVDALAKGGCEQVWMGAESGSQKVLDAMDKGISVEQISEATKRLRAAGIQPCFFIQFGYPGEEAGDIEKTIRMIKTLHPHDLGISVSYPLPGTRFYENVKGELKEKTNWTDSDELALMFRHYYPPAFYKKLHRYVHCRFRSQKGWLAMKHFLQQPASIKRTDWKTIASSVLYYGRSVLYKKQLQMVMHD